MRYVEFVYVCMYVPCIVCLPAERYAEESEQLTEEIKRFRKDPVWAAEASTAGGSGTLLCI